MMDYQCKECDTVQELPGKVANNAARRLWRCQTCEDVTSHENIDEKEEQSIVEREYLRQRFDTVVVTSRHSAVKTLHAPQDGDTLCEIKCDTVQKDIATYPPGYADWCSKCKRILKNERYEAGPAPEVRKDIVETIRQENRQTDGKLSTGDYRELDAGPSMYYVKKEFGTFTNAREVALNES